MAMRKSATQVLKRCFDSGKGLSWNPAPLGSSMRVFGSTSAYSNSAAAPEPIVSPTETRSSADDVDTVGWGSTKVGTLLKAKVRGSRSFSVWTRVREFGCCCIRSDVWCDGVD